MALFRFSRGPFKSGRFGKLVADARSRLVEIMETNPEDDFVQMFMTGMAKDAAGMHNGGSGFFADFTSKHALNLLSSRKGLGVSCWNVVSAQTDCKSSS